MERIKNFLRWFVVMIAVTAVGTSAYVLTPDVVGNTLLAIVTAIGLATIATVISAFLFNW